MKKIDIYHILLLHRSPKKPLAHPVGQTPVFLSQSVKLAQLKQASEQLKP